MLLNSLGRVLVASGLVAVTSFMASTAAFALETASVVIGGTAPKTLAIEALPANYPVDLTPGLISKDAKVKDLTFGSNNSSGLIVSTPLTGTFTLSNGSGTPVDFTVGITPDTNAPVKYVTAALGANVYETTEATAPNTAYSLYIKYSTNASFQDPGDYAATIVLNVADK
jgi:hypothetical protein